MLYEIASHLATWLSLDSELVDKKPLLIENVIKIALKISFHFEFSHWKMNFLSWQKLCKQP